MDAQLARPPKELVTLAQSFVCVRVVDMQAVDLSIYRFDYDLTFAMLFLHPDGTIYHRYGGRDHQGPMAWISMPTLLEVMRASRVAHKTYSKSPKPPQLGPRRTILDITAYQKRYKKKAECVHCHQIQPILHAEAQDQKRWRQEDIWIYPPPLQIGLGLDPNQQRTITKVVTDSPGFRSGLQPGDQLTQIGTHAIASISDVQAALEAAESGATKIPVLFRRAGAEQRTDIQLGAGWKVGTPLSFAWRPSKWDLSPAPGFGGQDLTDEEKIKLGVPSDHYAFRVTYLVNWGRRKHLGQRAAQAGLRIGDVVVAIDGKTDLRSMDHFHAWFRLTRSVSSSVEVKLLRAGERLKIHLPVSQETP